MYICIYIYIYTHTHIYICICININKTFGGDLCHVGTIKLIFVKQIYELVPA